MSRGAPDYSNVRAYGPISRLDDMSELAARTGSVVTHDRHGRVVFIQTFDHGLGAWENSATGTGAEVTTSAQYVRNGPYSCKLTSGNADGNIAKIFRKFPMPVLGRYGLEFSVKLGGSSKDFLWTLAYHDGTDEHNFTMKYVFDGGELQIKGDAGTYSTIATDIELDFLYSPFHTFKMVVDLENDKFVRLTLNEAQYDLSDYPAYIFVEDDSANVRVDLQQRGAGDGNTTSWVDDVILTQAEP